MSETNQRYSEVRNQGHDILNVVINLVEESGGAWKGQACELSKKILGVSNINPRALSVQLKKLNVELENRGIFVRHSINRGKHLIKLSNTPNIKHNETTLRHPNKHTPKNSDFATPLQKEAISFPFEWVYGTIEELSEEEKNEINCIRYIGRKPYQKPCSLCGEEGVLAFRKTSDCSSSLICESCAVGYARSALKLQEEHGVGRDVM